MTMTIRMTVNGEACEAPCHPVMPLLDVLRDNCGMTGTKYGCGEGECGACTVILNGELVMSCMVPAIQCDGAEVETVEGLATKNADGTEALHPLQQAFLETGGAQCGICTPGMIMAGVWYLRNRDRAPDGVKEALEGNLCRCTGYSAIFRAVDRAMENVP